MRTGRDGICTLPPLNLDSPNRLQKIRIRGLNPGTISVCSNVVRCRQFELKVCESNSSRSCRGIIREDHPWQARYARRSSRKAPGTTTWSIRPYVSVLASNVGIQPDSDIHPGINRRAEFPKMWRLGPSSYGEIVIGCPRRIRKMLDSETRVHCHYC